MKASHIGPAFSIIEPISMEKITGAAKAVVGKSFVNTMYHADVKKMATCTPVMRNSRSSLVLRNSAISAPEKNPAMQRAQPKS